MKTEAKDRTARLIAIAGFLMSLITGAVTVVNFFETRKNTTDLLERQQTERLSEAFDRLGGQDKAVLSIRYSPAESQDEQARVIEAGRIIEGVLHESPKNRRALELHAIYWGRLGRDDLAIRELRDLVSAAPKYASGWNALGAALLAANQLNDAGEAFKSSIRLETKIHGRTTA